jgi:hypothetical protein
MSYLHRILGQNEVLISRARFPWFYYVAAWGALMLSLAGAVGLHNSYRLVWLDSLVAAAGLIVFFRIMIWIWTTEIGVTNQRLIVKRGFPSRHTHEMELRAIEEIELDQSVLGRMLEYGRIDVQGTGDDSVKVPIIAHPLHFLRIVETAMAAVGAPRRHAALSKSIG